VTDNTGTRRKLVVLPARIDPGRRALMADNGTQHSEGQKALLDLESKFTAKKSSIYGTNGMQLRVLALFPRLFEDYPYPVVVTAAILKLADWFRQR
jgi:hypothetical protein